MNKIFSSKQVLPTSTQQHPSPPSILDDGLVHHIANNSSLVNYSLHDNNPCDIPKYGVDAPESDELDEVI